MINGRKRLELQAQAICREFTKGDKDEAQKLWAKLQAGTCTDFPLIAWTSAFVEAMQPLIVAEKQFARLLEKEAKALPCYDWVKGVLGFGAASYGGIVAECAGGDEANPSTIADYRSPAALWKRMGVGLVNTGSYEVHDTRKGQDGLLRRVDVDKGAGRQRMVAGEEALVHGYVPRRRAILWNVGQSLIKAQIRKDPDDAEKRIALGELGEVYLMRKEYELAREVAPIVAHRRAQRYMEKRLLRDLWREWRKL